jgi:phosphoenolpyruvate phosphomutase
MTADILHHGHINIITEARKYGEVVIGLLTDQAIANHKRIPILTWDQRQQILLNISGVTRVIQQNEWDYTNALMEVKPDFMIHGDDWQQGPLAQYREKAIAVLNTFGGKLVEIPYTKDVSSSALADEMKRQGISPSARQKSLRRILEAKSLSRFIEAHSPLSGMIAESAQAQNGAHVRTFDGFWSSSLTDSTLLGKPDIEVLDLNARLKNIDDVFAVTTKPLIMDVDTGGKIEHFEINIRNIERQGVSAIIVEDKKGLKKNSLFGNEVAQQQEDIDVFCDKIQAGRNARVENDMMLIARIESLILEAGMDDALKRASAYAEAGVDGIMIHSREKLPDEVIEFSRKFRKDHPDLPLVCVPTSYTQVTATELEQHGFNVVIYANHLLRASYPAMTNTAQAILEHDRALEADKMIMPMRSVLELIPGTK